MKRNSFCLAFLFSLFLAGAGWGQTQTFDLGNQSQQQTPNKKQQQGKKGKKQQQSQDQSSAAPSSGGMGWGGSIETSRYSRAAEGALAKGNYAAAVNFAEKVTQAAPNDARNWFLLGYTSRLAGKLTQSLTAYDHGLSMQPNAVEGLSGKAQTYIRMGKADEAKKLLLQVIAANPRRATDLSMAGELFMQSGDLARAENLLERSEAVQPSAHAEVLLAVTYMKSKQTDKAKALLDKAMRRDPKNVDVFRAVAQYLSLIHI